MSNKSKNKHNNKHHEQKKQGPRNGLIALLIFGTIALMFAIPTGINYSKLVPSVEKYMEQNGGAEYYSSIDMGDDSTMSITAKGNDMQMELKVKTSDAKAEKAAKAEYTGKDAEKNMKYIASYYLYTMKSQCRGLTAHVEYNVSVNGKDINSIDMSYRKAVKFLKDNGAISE